MTKPAEHLAQLRRLTAKQLAAKITESQKSLIVKRQEKLLGKLKNTAQLKQLRREIAQTKTILDERVMATLNDNIETND